MKRNWKQISIVFLVGLILGTAVGRISMRVRLSHFKSPEKHFEWKFRWFSRRLDLDKEQREKIKHIFEEKFNDMRKLREKVKPERETIRRQAISEVRGLLNEEQIEKFDHLEKRRQKRRERWKRKLSLN